MVRKSIDKIEAVGTFLIAAAVAAFAGFTPEEGATATDLLGQLAVWSFSGYGLFKAIIEFVKSQSKD